MLNPDASAGRFAVLADVHLAVGARDDRRAAATRRLLEALDVVADTPLVLLGDITDVDGDDPSESLLDRALDGRVPAARLPGNHDASTPTFRTGWATQLVNAGDRRDPYGRAIERHAHPGLEIWLSHYPLLRPMDVPRWIGLDGTYLFNARTLIADLSGSAPIVHVHGHLHTRFTVKWGALLQLGVASLVDAPHDLTFVSFESTPTPIVRVEARPQDGRHARVFELRWNPCAESAFGGSWSCS